MPGKPGRPRKYPVDVEDALNEDDVEIYEPRVGDVVAYYQNGDTTQDYVMAFVIGGNSKIVDLTAVSVTRGMRTIQGIRQVGDPFFSESSGRREILFNSGCWEEMSVSRRRQDKRRDDVRDATEQAQSRQREEQKRAEQERIQEELGWQITELASADLTADEIVRRMNGRVTAEQVNRHLASQGLAAV